MQFFNDGWLLYLLEHLLSRVIAGLSDDCTDTSAVLVHLSSAQHHSGSTAAEHALHA